MQRKLTKSFFSTPLALALAAALVASPVLAKKDEDHGPGHGQGHGKHKDKDKKEHGKHARERGPSSAREVRVGAFFNEQDRSAARQVYVQQGGRAHCPPGLAKKNNGCMPPGQAKKYAVGQPLPVGVVTYPVPPAVLITLPPPPRGHKYVQVAADVLLIAVGTSMVVDGLTGLLER